MGTIHSGEMIDPWRGGIEDPDLERGDEEMVRPTSEAAEEGQSQRHPLSPAEEEGPDDTDAEAEAAGAGGGALGTPGFMPVGMSMAIQSDRESTPPEADEGQPSRGSGSSTRPAGGAPVAL